MKIGKRPKGDRGQNQSTIQNVGYIEIRVSQGLPKFNCLKYSLDFHAIWVVYWWDIGNTWFKYGPYMIKIVLMYHLYTI